jgi:hypothetical protein
VPLDPLRTLAGKCGCGEVETYSDGDGVSYCNDECPLDSNKSVPDSETDSDSDCFPDGIDECPQDREMKVPRSLVAEK